MYGIMEKRGIIKRRVGMEEQKIIAASLFCSGVHLSSPTPPRAYELCATGFRYRPGLIRRTTIANYNLIGNIQLFIEVIQKCRQMPSFIERRDDDRE